MNNLTKKRKLYIAHDSEDTKYHIDHIDKSIPARFYCPYCKEEVIPKQGEKNVWHFAHKDQVCQQFLQAGADDGNNQKLDFSNTPKKEITHIDIGSGSRNFICVQCKKTHSKKLGKKWDATEYICNDCFNNL